MIVFLFVVLFALCCFNANFRTTTNIMNVLRQASFVAIIAMGEFFVILIANFPCFSYSNQKQEPKRPFFCRGSCNFIIISILKMQ